MIQHVELRGFVVWDKHNVVISKQTPILIYGYENLVNYSK
jgi:hypothetical protein